jgi:hypothetical protein
MVASPRPSHKSQGGIALKLGGNLPEKNTNNLGEVTMQITIDISIMRIFLPLVLHFSKLESVINKNICLVIDK